METDVVCGMDVDPATAEHSSEYHGKTYYFCSASCKRTFENAPEEFAGSSSSGGSGKHGMH